jgi:NhaA family Na+:H+ antiporter
VSTNKQPGGSASPPPPEKRDPLFSRGSWTETQRIAGVLRKETVGGALLLVGTVIALIWANSPVSESYEALRKFTFGPEALHLNLSLEKWAADGLLAIFFFVVGLELKREFVAGDLRDPRRAALPIVAAVGGMIVPALIYVAVNFSSSDALVGWAIPTATDIAFAVAVLAVIGTHLPTALRTFLLTLAVVDDLLAITIIAIFYTSDLAVVPLLLSLIPIAVFGVLVQRRVQAWWILLPLAFVAWALMHASGVHATVAGVLLGFTVPVIAKQGHEPNGPTDLASHFEHRFRPISAGVAVPVFAFFAAGVAVAGITEALTGTITLGIMAGLVIGKVVGIAGTSWLLSKFTKADLDPDLAWIDVIGVALLAGIGFTVSLLIGDLAFGTSADQEQDVKIGVLLGSLISSLLASVVLVSRNRTYKRIEIEESRDEDRDGIPDAFQRNRSGNTGGATS